MSEEAKPDEREVRLSASRRPFRSEVVMTTEQGGPELGAYEEILAARQKRAELIHEKILMAREAIRTHLHPASPSWLRDVFNELHAAHHVMGGDPFDMHMRAALAASPPQPVGGEVGKLEWLKAEGVTEYAKCDFGIYTASVHDNYTYLNLEGPTLAVVYHKVDIDAAKARAEADFSRRLSTLVPSSLLREAEEALRAQLELYVELVNSGDCGFWDPENSVVVKQSRAILAKIKETSS